ncbi:MAG: class I adenylate-forming enzyme family protein [Pseudomonadales bacterium]
MPAQVIHDILREHALDRPAQECVLHDDRRLTFRDLLMHVDATAKALLASGVARGDRVATLSPPGLEFWVTYLAATSIGAIWHGINPVYRTREFTYLLDDAAPVVVFVQSPFDGRAYDAELQAIPNNVREFVTFGDADGRAIPADAFLARGSAVTDDTLQAARDAVVPEDIAVIVYTSGTTGQPKGAMLSQGTITQSALANAAWMRGRLTSTVCAAPTNHVGALNNVCMNVFAAGGRIIFHERVDMHALGRLRATERPSYLVTSPTGFLLSMNQPGFNPERLDHFELIVCGGATTPISILSVWARTGSLICSVYGQTETCGIITHTAPDAPLTDVASTIGRPLAGCEARVAREDGSCCAVGEAGELQFRGPYVMSGYFNRPEATAAAFTTDGYLRTGDLGYQRADGNLVFVGRIKDMFKSGGYNVYPLEIEQAIAEHPQVLLSAVLPVPHPLYQEVGHAFVMPHPGQTVTEAALRAFLKDRIANYKVPKGFTVEPSLPLLPNGKIDRQSLAKRLADAS